MPASLLAGSARVVARPFVRTYRAGTAELSALASAADAAHLARAGYVPDTQAWDGTSLTVTYAWRPVPVRGPFASSPQPGSASRRHR